MSNEQYILIFTIVFAGILLLLGIIFFVVGKIVKKSYKSKLETCTVPAKAHVINMVKRDMAVERERHMIGWFPVLRYWAGGDYIDVEYNLGTNKPKYYIGQVIDIMYNPNDLRKLYVVGDTGPAKIYKVFLTVGTVLIVLGVLAAVCYLIWCAMGM